MESSEVVKIRDCRVPDKREVLTGAERLLRRT